MLASVSDYIFSHSLSSSVDGTSVCCYPPAGGRLLVSEWIWSFHVLLEDRRFQHLPSI